MSLSAYARNGIVDGLLRNQPFVVPVFCGSLHDGNPGVEGGSAAGTLVDTEEERGQIVSAASSNGIGNSTGDGATWVATEATTITYIGFHDAFTSGNWLGAEPLAQPVQVADGDTITLSTFTATLPE